jgi:hypothetical protein
MPPASCLFLLTCAVTALAAEALELNQAPAEPGEWGYRPAVGEALAVNPPAFSWRPSEGIATYTVQIASEDAFDGIIREQAGIPWNTWCPAAPLTPGAYFWRYRGVAKSGEETAWSTVRSFTVPADAVAFPQPTLPDLLSRMPKDGLISAACFRARPALDLK